MGSSTVAVISEFSAVFLFVKIHHAFKLHYPPLTTTECGSSQCVSHLFSNVILQKCHAFDVEIDDEIIKLHSINITCCLHWNGWNHKYHMHITFFRFFIVPNVFPWGHPKCSQKYPSFIPYGLPKVQLSWKSWAIGSRIICFYFATSCPKRCYYWGMPHVPKILVTGQSIWLLQKIKIKCEFILFIRWGASPSSIFSFYFCNEPIWLAHHSKKKKLWRLLKTEGYILKHRVHFLWGTYQELGNSLLWTTPQTKFFYKMLAWKVYWAHSPSRKWNSGQSTLHTKHNWKEKNPPPPTYKKKRRPLHSRTQLLKGCMEILFLKLAATILAWTSRPS